MAILMQLFKFINKVIHSICGLFSEAGQGSLQGNGTSLHFERFQCQQIIPVAFGHFIKHFFGIETFIFEILGEDELCEFIVF